MEDFKCMATVRFPELKKCLQRLDFGKLSAEPLDDRLKVVKIFEEMLRNSIECDGLQEIPISAFTDIYFCIIEKYFRAKEGEQSYMCCLHPSFGLLFLTLDKLEKLTPEYCVKFLARCRDASNRDFPYIVALYESCLDMSDETKGCESYLRLILDSFVKQRFHAWDIKNSHVLTMWLVDEEHHHFCENLFIKYGFKYNIDYYYFEELQEMFIDGVWEDDVDFDHYYHDEEMQFKTDEILRVQLAIELLVALFVNEKKRNAISLLWKALPYAFVTANELYNLLKPCVFERYDPLKSLCDKYEKTVNAICPVPKVPEPRTLKHLSRVQVRNSLIEVHNLSEEAIRELEIPPTLKGYLWLDDF